MLRNRGPWKRPPVRLLGVVFASGPGQQVRSHAAYYKKPTSEGGLPLAVYVENIIVRDIQLLVATSNCIASSPTFLWALALPPPSRFFWKASLSIKQPLKAHDPLHP